ncbi:minichromosome maintenance protein MCM [Candidatus Woesearchaeota archaeon]|nr:minichromosome maintenance protein MCM [Candidatus Woesearchaeota archaeon]
MLDINEQIRIFGEFIESNYKAELLEKIRTGQKFIALDFFALSKFSPELAEILLDHPEDTIKTATAAIEQFDLPGDVKSFAVRITNLPDSQNIMIRNIRSEHLGKLFTLLGVVRQKSDVRPMVTAARFECPNCGNIMAVLQLDNKFKEPSRCGCGRKGKFRLLSKELIDAQRLVLEEAPEDLDGGEQPKRMNVFLKGDLVSPISEKKTNPGQKIRVVGIVKEVPIILKTGGQSTRFDLLVEANYIETVEEDYSDITITKEDLSEIKELAEDQKLMKRLVSSIAPSIYGHEVIKEALLLQLAGGVRKQRDDGVVTRGDMHILLIGDPGSGKSMLLKRIKVVAPKGRFISGKGVSGAGLTAAVVRDEFLGGWSLEAGALVLANKGVVCIDELDKMSPEDRAAMHEALEGQTITISKANIQATLRCETTVLAAANPKFGRFDPYDTVANQIELPSTLINRFDLIFPIKDVPDLVKDEKMASFILNLHQNPNSEEPDVDTRLLRKYLAYAKQKIFPKFTDSAIADLKEYYLKMRASGISEGGVKSIPLSARQLEGLVRLAEASARLRLSQKVTKKDSRKAVELLDYCLKLVALDEETGRIDIDRIATDTPATERSKIGVLKEIINELENKLGKTIPLEDIIKDAEEKGLSEADVEEVIQRLKRAGDIFEPRRGFISKI